MQDLMTLKKGDFYTWEDPEYHDFMNTLLKKLNPIEYQKHTIIANELDEFNELIFCQTGQAVVGYEINFQKRYCMKLTGPFTLGAYQMTFNKKSEYIYTALTHINGFFVRRRSMIKIMMKF
jgi:hypothetical protein